MTSLATPLTLTLTLTLTPSLTLTLTLTLTSGMTMIAEGVAAGHMKHVTKEVKGDVGRCREM